MIETDGFYFTKGKEQKQLINLLLEKERSILREKDGTISVNGLLRRVKDAARNLFEVIGENGEKLFGIGSDGSIIGNQNTRGINVGVPLGSREIIVRGLTLASNEYAVSVTPSWNTTVWVSDKHAAGFTARFGTPAPEGASIDYLIQR
jgi:hypothetical protein